MVVLQALGEGRGQQREPLLVLGAAHGEAGRVQRRGQLGHGGVGRDDADRTVQLERRTHLGDRAPREVFRPVHPQPSVVAQRTARRHVDL